MTMIMESKKNWYLKNRDRILLNNRKSYLKNKTKILMQQRNRRIHNPNLQKNLNLLWRHNISLEKYNELFNKQDGRCAICKTHQDNLKVALSVDHDKKCCNSVRGCGKCIRGLLCSKCNFLIGLSNDSKENLINALTYLSNYEKAFYVI